MIHKFKFRKCLALLAVLFVVVGAVGFVLLAGLVANGSVQSFDDSGIRDFRLAENPAVPIGPHWLMLAAQDITALGGAPVLFFVTAAMVGFFAFSRKFLALTFILAAVLSGTFLNLYLKTCFERPRPHVVPTLCEADTSSFPSGHAMMSVVVYVTIAVLLAQMTRRVRLRLYLIAIAILLIGLIGTSRVYLGIHYPTDVFAGWTAGMVWVTLCWLPVRKFSDGEAANS